MISLQNAMLVTLGFLLACLIAFFVAPAYRRRLERISTARMRRLLPMSEAEMRADRDRVRAESAVRVFTLERQVEQARLSGARQTIDSSRRDARITEVENDSRELKSALDEAQNARVVLEQTITDRLPKVEHRLAEAKKLLYQRDREIAVLTGEAGKSARALEDAFQVNIRNRAELEKLTSTLKAQQELAKSKAASGVDSTESIEVTTLRERIRDQAKLIQKLLAVDGGGQKAAAIYSTDDATVDALRTRLTAAERALEETQASHASALAQQSVAAEQQNQSLFAKVQEQATLIARMQATLATREEPVTGQSNVPTPAAEAALAEQPVNPVVEVSEATAESPTAPATNGRDRRPLAERLVGLGATLGKIETVAAPSNGGAAIAALGAAANGNGRAPVGRERAPAAADEAGSQRLADRLSGIAKA